MLRPLSIEELKNMSGQPVYCPKINAYGIVRCETDGLYTDKPYLVGIQMYNKDICGCQFELDIAERNLECYPVCNHNDLMNLLDDKITFQIQGQDGTIYNNIEYFSSMDNCIYVKTKDEPKKHLAGKYNCSARAAEVFMLCRQAKGLCKVYSLPEK